MIIQNIKPSPWMLNEQAYIITSSIMELHEKVDPYGPQFPDPTIINIIHETVTDLINGKTDVILDSLNHLLEEYEGDEEIGNDVDELVADLHDYIDMYKEVHNENQTE